MFSKIKEVNGLKKMSYKVYCSAVPYEWNFSSQLTDMIDGQIDQGVDEYGDDLYYGEIREATLVNIIVEHIDMIIEDMYDEEDYDEIMSEQEQKLYRRGKRRFLAACKNYVKDKLPERLGF